MKCLTNFSIRLIIFNYIIWWNSRMYAMNYFDMSGLTQCQYFRGLHYYRWPGEKDILESRKLPFCLFQLTPSNNIPDVVTRYNFITFHTGAQINGIFWAFMRTQICFIACFPFNLCTVSFLLFVYFQPWIGNNGLIAKKLIFLQIELV